MLFAAELVVQHCCAAPNNVTAPPLPLPLPLQQRRTAMVPAMHVANIVYTAL
jgi:hypothetical protein